MRLFLMLMAVFWAGTSFAQITVPGGNDQTPNVRQIKFTTNHAVDTISGSMAACQQMWFAWDQATAGVVSAYAVEASDDTVSEVEAGALIAQFTTDGTYGPYTPTDTQVRFVVDILAAQRGVPLPAWASPSTVAL